MIQLLRGMMRSKFGIAIAIGFLVVIALAFAMTDVANVTTGAGGGGADRVATVGKEPVLATQLSQSASNALENLKREDPRVTMKAFLAQGGLDRVLDQLIDRVAIAAFGREHGVVASERLIDSEIAKLPAFKGPDGQFSQDAFRQALRQQGLSEKAARDDLAQGLIARQLLLPAEFGSTLAPSIALRYATLLRESRSGAIGLLPSAAFAPRTPPTDAELQAFYTKNRDRFIRPERRVLRYATFGDDALKTVAAPTEAEIAARYNANKAQYAAQEIRRITQLIVPTEAAAKAIAAEVAGGKRLEAVAAAKGLATAALAAQNRQAFAGQTSQAVADAAYAAASGSLAAPARSALGWHVLRVDGIERRPERTLDQVRGELTAQVAAEKRRAAVNDLSARLEEEFEQGGNLADAAQELGVTLSQTEPLTADGRVYGAANRSAPPVLTRLVQTAFAMEREGQPQLAEVEPGKTFVIFDVASIAASAPAPMAEIKGDVATMWALERGSIAAKAAADKVLAQTKQGTGLAQAVASLGVAVPPVEQIAMGREQLNAAQQQVPPALVLLFSMAKGTTKLLPAPENRGWFIVSLKDIVPGQVARGDAMAQAAQRELGQLAGGEYSQQLVRAIRAELGVKREDGAVRALRRQLEGGN